MPDGELEIKISSNLNDLDQNRTVLMIKFQGENTPLIPIFTVYFEIAEDVEPEGFLRLKNKKYVD